MDGMEEIERQLKQLAPRAPSARLDDRVGEALAGWDGRGRVTPPRRSRPAMARYWAWAACLAMGFVGFAAGRATQRTRDGSPRPNEGSVAADQPAVAVHVIFENRPGNPFDYTTVVNDGLSPNNRIQTSIESGATL